ncbi:MAG TPA: hypothetical protein VFV33_18680 [Gemmatimonadaceae bacterium]|nr:hypothetical protein [Gemmatimonadaceae bacterium]
MLPLLYLLPALAAAAPAAAQQVPDSAFNPAVRRPAYTAGAGPTICLDEAHHNFHTLDGRFLAFGRLASRDGFRPVPLRQRFTNASLRACAILVIANAQPSDASWNDYPMPTPPAFAPDEVSAVRAWVSAGGALLLIADHMPLAGAAASLASAFGVTFTNGFAVPRFAGAAARDSAFRIPTLFRLDDGTLAPHPVVRGRDSSEVVIQVRSFTGQAFRPQPEMAGRLDPVLVLPADYVSLEPAIAWRFDDSTPVRPVGGWLQGATRRLARGRVALFGEAAMFSAQVSGPERRPMGMNAPFAEQNPQFVLNVLHWLAGLLDPARE